MRACPRPGVALAASLSVLAGATLADAQFFREARSLAVPGSLPQTAAAAGDFNGDGIVDLAVDSVDVRFGSGLRVFLGLGGGVFAPPIEQPAVPGWKQVASADLNGDGKLDLFVAHGVHEVLFGDGAGHFTAQSIGALGGRSHAAIADVDLDGDLDLIGSESGPHTLYLRVYKGNGTGAFGPSSTNNLISSDDVGMAVGDITGDGAVDVVATERSGRINLFVNDGAGVFTAAGFVPVPETVEDVALMDLGGDGRLDMLVANPTAGTLLVLLGTGPGTFAPPVTYPGPGAGFGLNSSIAAADMDLDGRLDVIVTNGGAWVYRGLAAGALAAPVRYVATGLTAVADLDGDGKRDLAVGNAILLNQGNLDFDAPRQYGVGGAPRALATADFNHDGSADLATANRDTDDVSVLLGNGDGTFAAAISVPAGDAPHRLALADLNADGHVDIAAANRDSGNVSILLGNGAGAFVPLPAVAAGPQPEGVAAGDLNGDFRNDLAVATPAGIAIRLGAGGGSFVPGTTQALPGPGTAVAIANLNPDFRPDLVAGESSTTPLATMLGIGGAQFLAPAFPEVSSLLRTTVLPTDFNADASADLATGGANGPKILRGDGNGGLTEVPIGWTDRLLLADEPGLAAADFTRDGKIDVVTGSVSLLMGDGTSFSVFERPVRAAGRASALASADFNGDGQPDLAAALAGGDVVEVLLNQAASPGADLSVAITHNPDPAVPLAPLTFTITASNQGPLPAKGVRVGFHLPFGVGLQSTPPNCIVDTQAFPPALVCALGDIAVSGSASVAVPVTVSQTIGTLQSRADVDAVEPRDVDPFDNEVTHFTPVGLPADMTVTVEDSVDPVAPGAPFNYTVQVTNLGPGDAVKSVFLTDVLPAGVTFVSASIPNCQFAEPNDVNCQFGTFAPGQSVTFTITVQAESFTTVTNVVRVQLLGEANVANNEASEETRMDLATGRELLHGTRLQERAPAGSADRIYFIREEGRSSYEVIVDGLAGNVATPGGSVLLERLDEQLSPVQAATPVGTGPGRSLRWQNSRATAVTEAIRVRSTGCGTACDAGDLYRIRAYETTGRIARFRNLFTQVTVVLLQNPLAFDVHGTIWIWDEQGAPIASRTFTIGPRQSLRVDTSTLVPGQQGTLTVTHDAPYGSLAGKSVGLEPGTGFSFDTMMLTRPR